MTTPGGVALAGAVAIDVEPDASQFYPRLKAQVLPAADAVGRDIGARISGPLASQVADGIRGGVRDGGRTAAAQGAKTGDEIGAELARSLKARIEAGLKGLPEVKLDADSSAIDRKVANLRRQLEELRDKKVGVDLSTDEAEAKAQHLRGQLTALARDVEKVRAAGGDIPLNLDAIKAAAAMTGLKKDLADFKAQAEKGVTIKVQIGAFEADLKAKVEKAIKALPDIELKADSTDVERQLARVKADLQALHEKKIGVDIDAAKAVAQVEALRAELEALAAQSPNIQVKTDAAEAAAKLAAVGAEARAVGAENVRVDVDVDTTGAIAHIFALVASATTARLALGALAGGGGLLLTAIVPAAAAAAAAVAAIGPAAIAGIAGLGVLVLAFSGVLGAVHALDQGQKTAAASGASLASRQNAIANAIDQEASSERQLADAQRQARVDQEALTAAREAARRAMEDLNSAVANGALSQRAALLDLADAQQHLDQTMNNPQSTNIERQRAQLQLDQAKQRITDLNTQQGRLATDQAKAQQAGIEGSPQVVAAQEKIRASQEQVVQATQQLAASQRALKQAYEQASQSGAAGSNAVKNAMAGLSPVGQEFARFLVSLKPAFLQIRQAAETGLLPGVEAGIKLLLPLLPQIVAFVGILARTMGDLFLQASRALTGPFWQSFFAMLSQTAGPLLTNLATTLGFVVQGLAGLAIAFAPFAVQLTGGLSRLAEAFAKWAAGLSQSKGFQTFIAYVSENGPIVVDLLGRLAEVAIKLLIGLAPLGAVALKVADALASFLGKLSPAQLLGIAAGIGAIILAIVAFTGGPVTLIIGAIIAVVGFLVYAYEHFKTFRDIVNAAWRDIAAAAVWLWQVILRPTFLAIAAYISTVVIPVVLWLWRNVVVPAAKAMGIEFGIFWAIASAVFTALHLVITQIIGPVVLLLWHTIIEPAFRTMANVVSLWWSVVSTIFNLLAAIFNAVIFPTLLLFWHGVVEPVFTGVVVAIKIAWAIIEVIFGLISIAVKILAAIFWALYSVTIKPVFDLIWAAISFVWRTILKPIFDDFSTYLEKHVAPAFARGVDAIGKAWDLVRDKAKEPIRFVVQKVLNEGILAAYNWVAKTFKVDPHDVHIDLPAGFATGGYITGAGGPTDDMILARLSNGEYVMPANVVRTLGVGFFDWLRGLGSGGARPAAALSSMFPGDGSQGVVLPGFADGGLVGWLKNTWNAVTDPIKYLKDKALAILSGIPGGKWGVDILTGVGTKIVTGLLDWVRGKTTDATSSDGAYRGPISSQVADVQNWARAQVGKAYLWNMAGPDTYDCSGYMSAIYNRLNNRSPYVHTFSTSNEAQFFPKPGHGVFTVGYANPGERGGGAVGHTAGDLAGLGVEAISAGVRVGNSTTPVESFAHVGTYDSGGWLMPGITIAQNDSGRPEPVLTDRQWRDMSRRGGDTNHSVTYQIHTAATTLDANQLQAIVSRQEALARVGRPH